MVDLKFTQHTLKENCAFPVKKILASKPPDLYQPKQTG